MVILELIHAQMIRLSGRIAFISNKINGSFGALLVVNLDNCADRTAQAPATNLSSVCLINFRW